MRKDALEGRNESVERHPDQSFILEFVDGRRFGGVGSQHDEPLRIRRVVVERREVSLQLRSIHRVPLRLGLNKQ
ncbi:hypothetical protein [Natrarchaeobaculum sulfurireducens]|uniref:hypothetical protein n=1 Tax=Natrarchaeobaculum sulfurireducens TaxID=2044521 RepID=UPI000E3E3628|nr:hypothetical protein [Natrarchaeobaculum sulfurireducens]